MTMTPIQRAQTWTEKKIARQLCRHVESYDKQRTGPMRVCVRKYTFWPSRHFFESTLLLLLMLLSIWLASTSSISNVINTTIRLHLVLLSDCMHQHHWHHHYVVITLVWWECFKQMHCDRLWCVDDALWNSIRNTDQNTACTLHT